VKKIAFENQRFWDGNRFLPPVGNLKRYLLRLKYYTLRFPGGCGQRMHMLESGQ
jgi:hypothetical protein